MKIKVYRSLDKPSAFFGIRGRFVTWMVGGLVASLVLAFIVGLMTVGFLGIVVFLAGAAGSYMFIISLQGKMSDRELQKMLNKRKLPACVHVPPMNLRKLWTDDFHLK